MIIAANAAIVATPLGTLGLTVCNAAITAVDFLPMNTPVQLPIHPLAALAVQQLTAYFADPNYLFDLPLALHGTPFQQRVWQALRVIPVGQVQTYGEMARYLDSGARAIGGACRANPCPVLVPCHRVVASNDLGGYAGSPQSAMKAWLLRHEGVIWPMIPA